MVDSGTFPPETVISLSRRRAGGGAPASAEAPLQGDLLSLEFLLHRLGFSSEQVKMWAAYHLVDRWQGECERFIDALWNQPHEEIRDSAINLIGKFGLQRYAFPLLRLFRADDGALSHLAGVALGRLQYDPALRLLQRWFESVAASPETNPVELEAASESLLWFDNHAWWDVIFAHLEGGRDNHTFYSTLFGVLAAHADTPRQIERLTRAYGQARGAFNDVHLTQRLVDMAGTPHLGRYLQARLNGGYPLNTVYQECLRVLDASPASEDARALVGELARCHSTQAGVETFLRLSDELLDRLFPGGAGAEHARAFLHGCRAWAGDWEEGILKVRELEYHLIVSVPLAALLHRVEQRCLAQPEGEALRITHIYQSPLLSPRFMSEVLSLIAHRVAEGAPAGLGGNAYAGWVRDEEKDALWKLFTRQLDEVDYPFEQVLPQPWLYPIAPLMPTLTALLERRLPGYLHAGRAQAVDYCLEVFRRAGSTRLVPLLVEHFEALINHHYHSFVELMTHLPDARFLPPLIAHYREGEADLLQLVHFICDVHRLPYPQLSRSTGEEAAGGAAAAAVRLRCPECGAAYQYALEALYVNEERIEQRQLPAPRDVWTPAAYACKKCGAAVPFVPDERFLNELFAELLAARLMKPDSPEQAQLGHVHLIQFPVLDGRTRNPADFFTEVERALAARPGAEREAALLLELGRFRLELGQPPEAKAAFQRALAGRAKCPLALYYLGVIAFQEKNLYQARVHFSRLVQSCAREDFENELDNPVDMAHHYLKLLDRREFKRSHFHLISS